MFAGSTIPATILTTDRDQQWRIQGGRPPIFGKVNIILYIAYNVGKNIFEIEFRFYGGRNPRSF